MFLTKDFNCLIQAVRSIFFSRYTSYPEIVNDKYLENALKIELREANDSTKTKEVYEISVGICGPWRGYINLTAVLRQMFLGTNENVIKKMQDDFGGSFVTIFEYKLEPEPRVHYVLPVHNDGHWDLQLNKRCRVLDNVPEKNMTEIVFKSYCDADLDKFIVKRFTEYIAKTCFMFYDITVHFTFKDTTFVRKGDLHLAVPRSTSLRLKKYFKQKLGIGESVGSAWSNQDVDTNPLKLFDFTAVSYGIKGNGKYLPVWILGPCGLPVLDFNVTFFTQLICQAAELPIDLYKGKYRAPCDFPSPDICLEIPSQHYLSKRDHFLIIVLTLPIKHQEHSSFYNAIKLFDTLASNNWKYIVSTVKEVLQIPIIRGEEVSITVLYYSATKHTQNNTQSRDVRVCRGISASLTNIICNSPNATFSQKCLQLLKVRNSIDGQDEMEEYLQSYLKYKHTRRKRPVYGRKIPRNPNLPPPHKVPREEKDDDEEEEEEDEMELDEVSDSSDIPVVCQPKYIIK